MEFQILGPLVASRHGQPIAFHGARQRRLLAVLLLNANAVVSFDRLVDELWEASPPTARRQVHNAMAALRRSLTAEPDGIEIRTTEVGYRIDVRAGQLDSEIFRACARDADQCEMEGRLDEAVRHLQRALGLWRGPALPGLEGRLIRSAIAGLEEQRLTVLERLATLRLTLGEESSALSDLTQWVAEHPLRESLRASLMLALYRCGRQAEALEVYKQGRRLLAEQLGLEPSPGLKQLHERILLGTAEPGPMYTPALRPDAERRHRAAPLPRAAPVPAEPPPVPGPDDASRCTLPHDIVDFSGRQAELARLHAATSYASPTALMISTIDGMGGIGKTALAVRLAHQLRDQYPDGQHFIDLRGFTAGQDPLTPTHALDVLLRNVGVPVEQVPVDYEARVARWRSEMTGKRVLLVLDNAVDEQQVRPLLPSTPGSLVVITSRRHLSGVEGAGSHFLDVLPLDDAMALFQRVAGLPAEADQTRTAEVVDLCGRLPLAIRIAAGRLRHRPSWTVADLAERLRDQRRRTRFLAMGDRTVAAVLGLSYRYLRPELQRLFRLLSVPRGVDLEAHPVAAMAGISVGEAEQALDELVEDNLIFQRSAARYQLHDLVRDCAQEISEQQDTPADLRPATQRLLDYYLYLAWTACRPMARGPYRFTPSVSYVPADVPPVQSRHDAMNVLKTEHANLVEAARYAAKHDWLDHAWQIPCALQPFLTQMNYRENSLEMVQQGLDAARERRDAHGEAAMLGSIALIRREQGRFAEAERLFEDAIAISRRIDAPYSEIYQLADLGFTQRRDGRLQQAHDTFDAGRQLAERVGDPQGRVTLTNNLGVVCIAMGRYGDAVEHLQTALALLPDAGADQDGPLVLGNLGWALSGLGRGEAALAYFDQAITLSRKLEFRHAEAMALVRRAATRLDGGDRSGAVEDGRAALTVAREVQAHYAECEALLVIGDAFVASMEDEQAEAVYTQAQRIAVTYRLTFLEARGIDAVARLWTRQGRLSEAQEQFERALLLYPAEAIEAAEARRQLADLTALAE